MAQGYRAGPCWWTGAADANPFATKPGNQWTKTIAESFPAQAMVHHSRTPSRRSSVRSSGDRSRSRAVRGLDGWAAGPPRLQPAPVRLHRSRRPQLERAVDAVGPVRDTRVDGHAAATVIAAICSVNSVTRSFRLSPSTMRSASSVPTSVRDAVASSHALRLRSVPHEGGDDEPVDVRVLPRRHTHVREANAPLVVIRAHDSEDRVAAGRRRGR